MTSSLPFPTVFLSHGSPMLPLLDSPTAQFMRSFAGTLGHQPRAIVVASAHWETPEAAVTGAANPRTIHDFGGFPDELYRLHYPAPGDPTLAKHIESLLTRAGYPVTIDPQRGFDHGVWNPLMLLYPDAMSP